MPKQLFEINWWIMTDVCHFWKKDWKVFSSLEEAVSYGKLEESNLNDGLPFEEKINDGYCYQYITVREIDNIDGYPIALLTQESI